MAKIFDIDLRNKKVILRVDFDVPYQNKEIQDDFRIVASLPTINYLLKQNASIIILSHLGRPEGKYIPDLSLLPVYQHLTRLLPRTQISYTDEVVGFDARKKIARLRPGQIVILGNTRFYREEETDNEWFASEIAKFANIYINDAFAVSHREHTSVHAITKFLPSYPGLLLESEVQHLKKLLTDTERPYIAIIGGAKIKTKLPAIKNLMPKIDHLLLGGAVANTFLRAKGEKVGQSLLDTTEIYLAEDLIEEYPEKIHLPQDFIKDNDDPDNFRIMDIGQKTLDDYKRFISSAKIIFWNGDMGVAEQEKFAQGTVEIAQAIVANQDAYTVAAGGDTIAAIRHHQLDHQFDYISTGGGASLAYLAEERMPGLEVLGFN